ncbi:MAG: septum site-determining protein MinC [Thermodesulfobacteriota bacterium]
MTEIIANKKIAKLKGVGDGLRVVIDPSQTVESLQQELNHIFKPLHHLSINASVIIDSDDGAVNEDLVKTLGTYLKENFKVGSVSGLPPKPSARKARIRQKEMETCWNNNRSDVLMMTGRVRSGQKITAKSHLVLMGDVNPGGEMVAGGDIIVLGSLRGIAAAGQPDQDQAIIFALDFRPTQIQIGLRVAAGMPTTAKQKPEFAHVENSAIVVDDYLEATPFSKLPWPERR